jgi:hypothetical protein
MRKLFTRSLSVLAVAALASAGVAFTAGAAQALPASVTFSDQNCDIPTGGTLIPFIDGTDLTISNADTVDEALSYSIVLNFSTTYEQGTIAAGGERHISIPLPEDSDTTVQVFDTSEGGGLIGGSLQSVNCDPNYSPEAVATIADASCVFPTGGIIPPSPGFSFTLDNSAGTGPADYEFVAGDTSVESGVVAPGDVRTRAWSLSEDESLNATISSVNAAGEVVLLASATESVNCEADTPVITSPTEGQVALSPVTITGTGTVGDEIAIAVGDASTLDPTSDEVQGFLAEAVPSTPVVTGDGFTVYATTVGADGTFTVTAALDPGDYGVTAVAAREAAEDGTPASISDPSAIVRFSVVAAPVTPPAGGSGAGSVPAGTVSSGGTLATTGFDPMIGAGSGLALLVVGGIALALIRRRRTV